jgi:hypothetical protein
MKKVLYGVSLLQLVLTWPTWVYHDVKFQWTQVLPYSFLAHSLWLKTTGVPLTPTKCIPRVLEHLSFIWFVESWMSRLTPYWSLLLFTSLTQVRWSLNDSPNLLTSYPSTPSAELRSMLRSTSPVCYVCTEFRKRSFLIEGRILSLAFGSNCTCPSELTWSVVQPITHRRMAKLNESIKS